MDTIKLVDGNGPQLACMAQDCGLQATAGELVFLNETAVVLRLTCPHSHKTILEMQITKRRCVVPAKTTMRSKVAGVTFSNPDGTQRQQLLKHIKPGDRLAVDLTEREGKPAYMLRHPIGVIGSLRPDAIREFQQLNPNAGMAVFVVKLTGGAEEKETIGCNIELRVEKDEKPLPVVPPPAVPKEILDKLNQIVYIDPAGRPILHTDQRCSGGKNMKAMPAKVALNRMRARPCKKCASDFEPLCHQK